MANKGETWVESQRFQEGTAFRQESGASPDPFAASPVRELYTAESAKAMVAKCVRRSPGTVRPKRSPRSTANWRVGLNRSGATGSSASSFRRITSARPRITSGRASTKAASTLSKAGSRATKRPSCGPFRSGFTSNPCCPTCEANRCSSLARCNGFFSFRFAEAGAASVTGVEVVEQAYASAVWAAGVLGHKNVEFLNTDFLMDLTLQPRDVVFLSEVHNHFLMPFYGLCRLVHLAKETLILDTAVRDMPAHSLELTSGWERDPARLLFHSFYFSDGLLLDFLNLIGIAPERVTRYRAPGGGHTLYYIDTRHVAERRRELNYPEYLRKVIELEFVLPKA